MKPERISNCVTFCMLDLKLQQRLKLCVAITYNTTQDADTSEEIGERISRVQPGVVAGLARLITGGCVL